MGKFQLVGLNLVFVTFICSCVGNKPPAESDNTWAVNGSSEHDTADILSIPFPIDRDPSSLTEYIVLGKDTELRSYGVSTFQDSADIQVRTPGGRGDYAQYRLNRGVELLTTLIVEFDPNATMGAYVGVSDYGNGRWEWSGPYADRIALNIGDGEHVSPTGDTWVTIFVPNRAPIGQARVDSVRFLPVNQASITVIDEGSMGWSQARMISRGPQSPPAIAYSRYDEGGQPIACFVTARDRFASSWLEIQKIPTASSGNGEVLSFSYVNGRPAILAGSSYIRAYASNGGWPSSFAQVPEGEIVPLPFGVGILTGDSFYPSIWPHDLDAPTLGASISVGSLGNICAVSPNDYCHYVASSNYNQFTGRTELLYSSATYADGSLWYPPIVVVEDHVGYVSLEASDPLSSISYVTSNNELAFVNATLWNGQAWSDVVIVDGSSAGDWSHPIKWTTLARINGTPAIVYSKEFGLANYRHVSEVWYVLASAPQGQRWGPPLKLIPISEQINVNSRMSLIELSMAPDTSICRPAVCLFDEGDDGDPPVSPVKQRVLFITDF